MTTKTLEKIRELHSKGLNDRQISVEIGMCEASVWYWRKKLGLTANRTFEPKAFYVIYDRKDNVLATGSASECAEALGIQIDSVYRMAHRAKKDGSGRVIVENI